MSPADHHQPNPETLKNSPASQSSVERALQHHYKSLDYAVGDLLFNKPDEGEDHGETVMAQAATIVAAGGRRTRPNSSRRNLSDRSLSTHSDDDITASVNNSTQHASRSNSRRNRDPLSSQSEHMSSRRTSSNNSRPRAAIRKERKTDHLSQSEHTHMSDAVRKYSANSRRLSPRVSNLNRKNAGVPDSRTNTIGRSHSGPQRGLNSRPIVRSFSGNGLSARSERRRRLGAPVDSLSQSEHHNHGSSPTENHRSSLENLPISSNVQETTLELLDLIKRRRQRAAAGKYSRSSRSPKRATRRRERSFGSTSSHSVSSVTSSSTHKDSLVAAPQLQPKEEEEEETKKDDMDDEDSQESPKSALEFPLGGRKRAIVVPDEEEANIAKAAAAAAKEEEDNKMRLEIARMKQRLADLEAEKQMELDQIKQQMEEGKAKLKAEAKIKFADHLETELELQQLAMNVEKKRIAILQEELEEEQAELKGTKAELRETNKTMVEENNQLQVANDETFRMYRHLSKWVAKKTRHNEKLVPAEAKLVKILMGSISLVVEAKQSKIYRSYMYQCAQGVNGSDMYDFELDEEVMNMIRDCETNECSRDPIALVDYDEWKAQQEQEEKDPLHDLFASLKEHQVQPSIDDGDQPTTTTTATNTTTAATSNGTISSVTTSDAAVMQRDPMDESSYNDEEEEEHFEQDMEELHQSMVIYESVLAEVSVTLDATQMNTLYENKNMLLTIFRFLDTDKSGDIDEEEFRVGIELLNSRLPAESQFEEREELFQLLDVDGTGTIDINQFEKVL